MVVVLLVSTLAVFTELLCYGSQNPEQMQWVDVLDNAWVKVGNLKQYASHVISLENKLSQLVWEIQI